MQNLILHHKYNQFLSLINKIPAISTQILFILCKISKIHHIFIYTPQIPHTAASTGGLEIYSFFWVGDLGMVGGIGIFVVIFLFQIGY